MPPGHSRQLVHPGKCFRYCFFLLLNEINCGLALKHKRWMKLKFWLVSPVKHLMIMFSLMFSCLEGRGPIPFSSATYPFFTDVFWEACMEQHIKAMHHSLQHCAGHPEAALYLHNSSYPKRFSWQGYQDWQVWIWPIPPEAHQCLGWRWSCWERRKHSQKCLLLLLNPHSFPVMEIVISAVVPAAFFFLCWSMVRLAALEIWS